MIVAGASMGRPIEPIDLVRGTRMTQRLIRWSWNPTIRLMGALTIALLLAACGPGGGGGGKGGY